MCGPQLSRKRPLIFMPRAGHARPPTLAAISVGANIVRPPVPRQMPFSIQRGNHHESPNHPRTPLRLTLAH